MAHADARRREDVYDGLVRELVHVPSDARDAVASFLQDLRRDGVDWDWLGDNVRDPNLYMDCEESSWGDDERFFRECAGVCMWATRIPGSACLKFAHEHGAPWNEWTCEFAAKNGNLDCLKYAHENGCDWYEETCECAAENGHLECLKYAHENGCPWDEATCALAAWNGHLEMLKYAHENRCD